MDHKNDIKKNLLCMACLCVGRSIHEIKDEKLKKYYMDILNEIPLNNIQMVVPIICWECDAVLKKVLSFREQVKDSYRILQTYTENLNEFLLSDVSRTPRLKIHINDPVTINPPNNDLKEIKIEISEDINKREKQNGNVTSDVSDTEPEIAIQTVLCDVKTDRKKRKNVSRSNKPRQRNVARFQKDPVAVELRTDFKDVKIEWRNDLEKKSNGANEYLDLSLNDKNEDLNTSNEVDPHLNEKRTAQNKSLAMQPKLKVENEFLEMDDLKMESDAEYSLGSRNSDIDVDDLDKEIQSLLRDVNEKDEETSKKTNKKVKKGVSQKILTVDLTYDEMQTERSRLANRESFVRAQYKCETCLILFNCASSQKAHHSKKHETPGNFICSICKTIISTVEAFTAHYRRHTKRYECAVCKKRSSDLKAMYQHMYKRHQISLKKYKCNVCGKLSKSIDSHRIHRDSHKARVACSQCDKTFSHRAGLMNHRLTVHESQNEFPCTVCDKVFRWKTSLKRHLEKHDTENKDSSPSKRAYCASCEIAFSSVCSLQRHLRNSLKHVTHDQLKFICDHCNQRFADKTKLRDHIEEKHLHRTFQCPICYKPSKNRVGLEQHVRAVHKGRPNNRMCHHCGKGFPTKVQLESHIRTHTGERPFMCEFCPTTFSQQSNLYKHHRQVHLNIKSKRYLCKKMKIVGNQAGDPQQPFTLPIMQYMPENGFSL
ncbi:zinc finger protein 83-like [Vanessa atalanta]|uniref:zinc finger protein 83-like n=1 Tax=Vanessa atalanta TaxID=42275 RepID=UPI001FCE0F29|nr:zinc finger protein 83-like [Vanessa atalanta]